MDLLTFWDSNYDFKESLKQAIECKLSFLGLGRDIQRLYWELGNSLYRIFSSCVSVKVSKLNSGCLDVFTLKPSCWFFPELQHLKPYEYCSYYRELNTMVSLLIEKNKPKRIVDYGCGISLFAPFLLNSFPVMYLGIDNCLPIIDANRYLLNELQLQNDRGVFLFSDFIEPESDDLVLLFNVVKKIKKTDFHFKSFYNMFKSSGTIVVYDQLGTINEISEVLTIEQIPYSVFGNYLIKGLGAY